MTEPEPTAAADEPPGPADLPEPEPTGLPPDVDAMDADLGGVGSDAWPRHAVTEVLPVVPAVEAEQPPAEPDIDEPGLASLGRDGPDVDEPAIDEPAIDEPAVD